MSEKPQTESVSVSPDIEGTNILSGFLDNLVPPTDINVVDIYGNEYQLKSKVSARVQIKIGREFESAMKDLDIGDIFGNMDETVSGMVSSFMSLAGNENVLEAIDNCFQVAHSSAYLSAVKAAKKDKSMVKNPTAVDLFSLEDILGGVLPLFLGLIQKGAAVLTKIAQNNQ